MAKARRAKARPSRVVVPLVALLVVAAAVIGWQVLPSSNEAGPGRSPSVLATRASAPPTPSSTGSASTSGGGTGRGGTGDGGTAALTSCRAHVQAANAVLEAARTGIGHWADHVQAQTDADQGDISVDQMDGVFAKTRLAGPADQERYAKARKAYAAADGSCAAVPGAPADVAQRLASCRTRDHAQQPVLEAAAPAMADWKSHLGAMGRSRSSHVENAEQVWLDAWRAAPPHIRAYRRAADHFSAPDC